MYSSLQLLKMNKSLLVILTILISISINAQCPNEDQVFTSQAQLDSFKIQYPNCEHIEVDIEVAEHVNINSITDLSCFNNLKSIDGDLTLSGLALITDLNGFNNLTRISERLDIRNLENLEQISGFQNLLFADAFSSNMNDNLKNFVLPAKLDTIGLLNVSTGFDNSTLTIDSDVLFVG